MLSMSSGMRPLKKQSTVIKTAVISLVDHSTYFISRNIGGTSVWCMPVAGLGTICCALLCLFIIAGMIVLALIPTYLQRKTVDKTNSRMFFSLSFIFFLHIAL